MPLQQGKRTVAATVSEQARDKIKRVATLKHWSMAQTLGLFIDAHWDDWEKSLGIGTEKSATPKTIKKKSVS